MVRRKFIPPNLPTPSQLRKKDFDSYHNHQWVMGTDLRKWAEKFKNHFTKTISTHFLNTSNIIFEYSLIESLPMLI